MLYISSLEGIFFIDVYTHAHAHTYEDWSMSSELAPQGKGWLGDQQVTVTVNYTRTHTTHMYIPNNASNQHHDLFSSFVILEFVF